MDSNKSPRVAAVLTLIAASGGLGCQSRSAPSGTEGLAAAMPAAANSNDRTSETTMKPVTIINRLTGKPGKMDAFIDAQRKFAADLPAGSLLGGRMYRGVDGQTAVLVSTFPSKTMQEQMLQSPAFREHVQHLQSMIDGSSPLVYEEAYTTGDFR
jgi:hypothetical protein